MENIEKRLTALEKSNARYRILIFCMLAVITYFAITAFSYGPVPDLVQAKKFELVDNSGNVLARLEDYNGAGAITTYLPDGSILTDIVATKSRSGGIVLYDGKGKKNMMLTDVNGGGGSLVIMNPAGQTVLSLGRNNMNSGSVTISDGSKTTVLITGDTDGNGAVLTYNKSGTQTARLPQ